MARELMLVQAINHNDYIRVVFKVIEDGEKERCYLGGSVKRDDHDASGTMWMAQTHNLGRNVDVVSRGHASAQSAVQKLLHEWVESLPIHDTVVIESRAEVKVFAPRIQSFTASL